MCEPVDTSCAAGVIFFNNSGYLGMCGHGAIGVAVTLHYLGRSDEALSYLDKGASLDAANQRIWLTLGYVNSQLGNVDEAREALNKATQIGNDESIRRSAQSMLDGLPD